MNPKSGQKEGTVDDKSWELNIRERFREIEEENSKLPQNLEPSENKTLLDLCEKIKLFSNGYVKHKIHELDKYVWDKVQKFEAVQRELEQIAENEKLHCKNFRKVFPWTKQRYTMNHQIAHAMVRSLCHLHPKNLNKLILHFAIPEERTTSNVEEYIDAHKKFLGGILAAEAQDYLPLMNDWDARYHLYIQNNPVLLGNMCLGLMALNTDCCLIPFRNDWRATTAFFEQKTGPFYQFLNEDLQLSIVQSNNPRQNKNPRQNRNPRQNNNPRLCEITVQNSLAHLRLLDDIDFHYLIVYTWDPHVVDPAREYIWKHTEKSPEKTSFTQHVMQAVQKAKNQGSCKFWEEILLRTPQSLNYRRSLYVEHDLVYTPEIDRPSEVWLTCYVCNELIGIAQAFRPWEGLVVTNNPIEQDLAQPTKTALSPKLGKLDARMSFLNSYLFKDNSGTSGITHPILRTTTAYNPYIVDLKTSNPYYVNLETSTGHLSYMINIKTSGNMDNLDFKNDEVQLLEVLKILAPGIDEPNKYTNLLKTVVSAVHKTVDDAVDWETETSETRQYTMIQFLEELSAFQKIQIQNTINYFWRIFDATIYEQACTKLNCPVIQGLFSSSFVTYSVFFDLCSSCSWNDQKTENFLRNFRTLVLQRNWDSVLVKDNIYGKPEERFVGFFTKFVNENLEMPTNTIDDFKKKCEKNNKKLFEGQKTLNPNENKYELYTGVKKFWRQDEKTKIDNINSMMIPQTTTNNRHVDGKKVILEKWKSLLTSAVNLQNISNKNILKEIQLMEMPEDSRNLKIQQRIERRALRDAEKKQAAEELAIRQKQADEEMAIREQKAAEKAAEELAIREQAAEDESFATEMATIQGNNSKKGTRIAKRKTPDEIIADEQIFQHASQLYKELYNQDLDADLFPDFFKMRTADMTEKAQQTRIRNILEHHKTYAKRELIEGSYDRDVQEIWKITNKDFKRDVGQMTAALPIIERILPRNYGIRSLDDLAKSIIKEYMRIELPDGAPLEGKTIDKTFKLALIIDKARELALYSTTTLERIHKSNLDSKHILSALEADTERYEEMLIKLEQPAGHREDIEKWVQDLEINEDTMSFWRNIFDEAKKNPRKFNAKNPVIYFLKQKRSGAHRRTQAQALVYIQGLYCSNGEAINPLIDNASDFKYAKYEAIPTFPKRDTTDGKKLYWNFTVEKFWDELVKRRLIDPNDRTLPKEYKEMMWQLAKHKRQEHEVWLQGLAWKARIEDMLKINSQTPETKTTADSDVEVKRSADFNLQTTENDPSLPVSVRDPSLPVGVRDQSLQASGSVTDMVVLHNSEKHKPPATRLPSMPWKCNCCNLQFQTWMYIPPAASEEQVVVVPASPMDQVNIVPAAPVEHSKRMFPPTPRKFNSTPKNNAPGPMFGRPTVSYKTNPDSVVPAASANPDSVVPAASVEKTIIPVVPEIIIPYGESGLRDHIKYSMDSRHMKEMDRIMHYEDMTRVSQERSGDSNDKSWQVSEFAETYTHTLGKKEMHDLDDEDWKIKDTLGTVEKYKYQSIDNTVIPHIGIVGDLFWEKTFFYYDYLENMKRSLYGRQQGPAATEAIMFDITIHERVGQKFAIKLFETNAETEMRERVEGMKNASTLSNEEEMINYKAGKRGNDRAPGLALKKKTKAQRTLDKNVGNLGGKDKDDHDRFIRDEIDRDKEKHGDSDDEYDNDENGPGYINIGGQRYNFK